jgi:hypothetical protein
MIYNITKFMLKMCEYDRYTPSRQVAYVQHIYIIQHVE